MPKGTFQIKYEKLVMDNLDLKEQIKGLEADIKIKQSVADTIIKEVTTINDKLKEQIEKLKATKCPPISDGDSCICPIEELEAANKRLQNDYNCVASLCDSVDEFGELMKDTQWTNLGERIYEIVVEQVQRIKDLETLLEQLILIAKKADTDDSEDTTIELAKQVLKPRT